MDDVSAALRAAILNGEPLNSAAPFEIAGYRVEPSLLTVARAGEVVRLESKTMQVLVYLVQQAGRVVSRRELEDQLWSGRIVTEDSVTSAISKLRRAFGDDARHPRVIETVPKNGYRLIAPVVPNREGRKTDGASLLPLGRTSSAAGRWRLRASFVAGIVLLLLLLWIMLVGAWFPLGKIGSPPVELPLFSGKPTLAVLPFKNLGIVPDEDYFANGMTADLITGLSKVEGLLVIAPGSVFAYGDSTERPRQISAALEVGHVVVGSVQRSGNRLRVNVQLIEVSAEQALWGERYSGVMDDLFDVQDRIVVAVIDALKVELAPAEQFPFAERPTVSIDAYDHYLRGIEAHGRRSEAQNLAAMDQFSQAIELDSGFARAYAGLAMAHSRNAIDGWTATPSRSLELAAEFAGKAADIEPLLPQVHFVDGQIDLFQRRHYKAAEAAERAIRADPNYADAFALSAWILNYAGRPEEASTTLEKAMRLNPRAPASYLEILGEIRFVQRRYDESVTTFHRVLRINPDYMRARMWLAAALALTGSSDSAAWEVTELLALSPDLTIGRLGFAFPFKNPRELDLVLDGLRRAGLPE